MPSEITQNIGTAAVPALQHNQHANRQQNSIPNQQQVAQVSQAASENALRQLKTEDKDRATNIPKKVDGSFAPQRKKAKSGRNPSEEEKEPKADGLDVVA